MHPYRTFCVENIKEILARFAIVDNLEKERSAAHGIVLNAAAHMVSHDGCSEMGER
jgi:hypothetical protein